MQNIYEVAAYIFKRIQPMPLWKLQALCYLCQAKSLAWDNNILFRDKYYATKEGPYCFSLSENYIKRLDLFRRRICFTAEQKITIDTVLKYYGGMNKQCFENLFEAEKPLKNALLYKHSGLTDGLIEKDSIQKFHGRIGSEIKLNVSDVKVIEKSSAYAVKKNYSLEYAGCIVNDIPYKPDDKQKDIFKKAVIAERALIREINVSKGIEKIAY